MSLKSVLFVFSIVALTACGKSENKEGPGKGGGGAPAGVSEKLKGFKTALGAAQTSADVDKVMEDCSSLLLDTAMSGTDLQKNAEYTAVCEVETTKTLANVVIKTSTPEKMDTKCITASMRLDELIEKKVEVEAMTALNDGVKKACGM